MEATKQLGIWMDHATAHLMELSNGTIVSNTVGSEPELEEGQEIVNKDESHTLNKEQGQLSAFYKKLSNVILDYDEVILFGPTDAKNELLNLVKDNHLYEKIKIETKSADNMTENERITFVEDYFQKGQK